MSQTKAQLVVGLNVNASAPASALQIDASGNINLDSNTLYVDAANNRVGIGTSAPDNKLSVGIASADEGIELKATYNGARVARFGLVNPGVDNTPYIGSVAGNDFGFITSNVRRMTLDASGRLGIGTTSPSTRLHVSSADASATYLRVENTGGYALFGVDGSGNAYAGAETNDAFGLVTNGSYRMYITAGGNVGIGTSSPGSLLTVKSQGAATTFFNCENSGGTSILRLFQTAGGSGRLIVSDSSGTDFFNVQADQGRVGIGTTSPANALHVSGASGTTIRLDGANNYSSTASLLLNQDRAEIRTTIDASGGNPGGTLLFRTRNTSGSLVDALSINNLQTVSISSASGVAPLIVSNGGGEAFRVDDSRRLLVGTSSSSNLYAIGGANFAPKVQIQGTDPIELGIQRTDGPPYIHIANAQNGIANGTDIGFISFNAKDSNNLLVQTAQISAHIDNTPGANDMPGRLVFSTTADGASSPTERARITNDGYFKASNNGNYSAIVVTGHQFYQTAGEWTTFHVSASSNPYGIYIRYTGASPNGSGNPFLTCYDSGSTLRAEIRSNGGLANYSANNSNLSDINAKKDISPAADTWDCIKEWEIVNYRYKDQPDDADLNLGVIAQQVAESCPEVITVFQEAKEATEDQPAQEERLGVKEQQMYWMAIKALQEAQVRIEALEAEVAALKAQ